jgi:hypothetical protein
VKRRVGLDESTPVKGVLYTRTYWKCEHVRMQYPVINPWKTNKILYVKQVAEKRVKKNPATQHGRSSPRPAPVTC